MPITDIRQQVKEIVTQEGVSEDVALKIAQKCYDDIMWRPYGGATSYAEIDAAKAADNYSMAVRQESYALESIVSNITVSEDMKSADEKAEAIKTAADEYKKRIASLNPEENKSLMDHLKSWFTADKTIRHEGGKWNLYSKSGKRLGSFDSKAAAEKRESQIEYFKHQDKTPSSGFKVYLDADGAFRWLAVSSNAFEDRDKELFTTKALEEAIEHADKTGERGPLLVYHVPSAEIGQCDFQGMAGRFLIESGTFDDTPLGNKALDFYTTSDEEQQVSIGYTYIDGDELDGQYDWLRIKERSVCPTGTAANPWTSFKVLGESPMNSDKVAVLEGIFGKDMAAKVISEAESATKTLEDSVKFKEKAPEAVITAEDVKTLQEALKGLDNAELRSKFELALKSVAVKEEEAPAAENTSESPTNETVVASIPLSDEQVRNLAGLIGDLTAKVESFSAVEEEIKTLREEIKSLKKSDDEKVSEIMTPRWTLKPGDRPSDSDANVVTDGKIIETVKEELPTSPAAMYVQDLLDGKVVRA